MTNREFFLARRKSELPAFLSVLKALPADAIDYKPHDRSPSARQVAWVMAMELGAAVELCDTAETKFPTDPAPDAPAIVAAFEKGYAGLVERVSRMDDAAWTKVGRLKSGGKA